MKTLLTTLAILMSLTSVSAQTLEGGIEKHDDSLLNGNVNQTRLERPVLQGQTGQNLLQGQDARFSGLVPFSQVGNQPLLGNTSGGERAIGCLGATVDAQTGLIQRIYPASNLNQFDVQVGDRIVEVDNHRFHGPSFSQDCLGIPGQPLELVVLHQGRPVQIYPQRVDSRALAPDSPYFRQWANQTKQW